jgi:SAM-dependent methyltransferase
MTFHDHFSDRAAAYARFRPTYPPPLFEWLAAQAPARQLAWDAGTGNGQAAVALAGHFARVVATDPSAEQLRAARQHPSVHYAPGLEAESGLAPGSADLVTAAQALHWFDLDAFYKEARRVLRPEGVLAVWSYGLHRVSPEIDALFDRFYTETVGPWWPPERRHVEAGYRTLPFPFPDEPVPAFAMEAELDRQELLAYVATWSAVKRKERETNKDPMPALTLSLEAAWGDPGVRRVVRWPLALRVGRSPAGGA